MSEIVLGVVRNAGETCGHEAAQRVLRRRRRFTLFFIPLVAVGTQYADVCTWCGRGLLEEVTVTSRAVFICNPVHVTPDGRRMVAS